MVGCVRSERPSKVVERSQTDFLVPLQLISSPSMEKRPIGMSATRSSSQRTCKPTASHNLSVSLSLYLCPSRSFTLQHGATHHTAKLSLCLCLLSASLSSVMPTCKPTSLSDTTCNKSVHHYCWRSLFPLLLPILLSLSTHQPPPSSLGNPKQPHQWLCSQLIPSQPPR